MQTWKSWSVASAIGGNPAPTWDEWCARLQSIRSDENRQQPGKKSTMPFNERELARLSFVRWLYLRGFFARTQTNNVCG